jgi:hypothetical protein
MNRIMTEYYPTFQLYQSMRGALIDLLSDEELSFTPGGANPPLGEVCREIGEIEHAYVQSFKNFKQDFSYSNNAPGLAGSVDQLKAWFAELDQQLQTVVEALSDEDIGSRAIDRGGFQPSVQTQLEVYKEALMIFYGKLTVYFRAMNKELPENWKAWIG